jgi:DHA1 family multidrug resistance protein-like MFS transporter
LAKTIADSSGSTSNGEAHDLGIGWIKPTIPVAIIALFAELGYGVLNNSTFPVYLKDGLGIDPALIGPIMMPFFLSELLKGPFGVLADKIGRKPLMAAGPAVTIVTPLIVTFIHYRPNTVSIPLMIAFGCLRFVDGLGASALWPASFAYLGDVVRPEKRASAMSVLNVTYMVGLALGFLAGGFADDSFHIAGPNRYFPSFYLASLLFALATFAALFGIGNKGYRGTGRELYSSGMEAGTAVSWQTIKESICAVPLVLLLAFVTFFGIGCVALQVKIFALDEFGISETQFGILFLWPALLIGALAIPLGRFTDKWGEVKSIRLGFFIAAASMWAMIVLVREPSFRQLSLVISGTLLGIGFVIAFPAWLAYLTTLTTKSNRGTVIGAASTAQAVGVLLGTIFGGWLYRHASPAVGLSHLAPFIVCALFLSVGTLGAIFWLKQRTNLVP